MPVNTIIQQGYSPASDSRLALYGTMPRGYTRGVSPIAINLLELRKQRGLTQEQVAERGTLKQSTVSKYERGHARPDLKSLLKLAVGLGLDLNAIIVGEYAEYDDLIRRQNKVAEVGRTPIDGFHQPAETLSRTSGEKETSYKEPPHVDSVSDSDSIPEGRDAFVHQVSDSIAANTSAVANRHNRALRTRAHKTKRRGRVR